MIHSYQVIQYQPQNDKPQLLLLRNRMYSDDFKINSKNLVERKENYKKRVVAITGYITNIKSCRSVLIGNYFNDKRILPCGICDNCINNKNIRVSMEEFKIISGSISTSLEVESLNAEDILKKFKPGQKQHVWTVINYMISENSIVTDKDGKLILK